MNFMALNWLRIPSSILKASWQKYDLNQGKSISNPNSEIDLNQLIQLGKQLNFQTEEIKSWIASDLFDNGFGILSDNEIINQVLFENPVQAEKIDENNKVSDSPALEITAICSSSKNKSCLIKLSYSFLFNNYQIIFRSFKSS